MKKIVLFMTLSMSIFTMACGGGNSTCQEAYDEIGACPDTTVSKDAVKQCKNSDDKDAIIECSNEADCDKMKTCLIKLAFSKK